MIEDASSAFNEINNKKKNGRTKKKKKCEKRIQFEHGAKCWWENM